MPKSIAELVIEILQAPAPVAMLDTCAVLDIIRTPSRETIEDRIVLAAQTLLSRARAQPRTLWLILTEIVASEWDNHRDNNCDDLQKWLRRIDKETVAQDAITAAEIIATEPNAVLRASDRVVHARAPSSTGKSEFKDCSIYEHYLGLAGALHAEGFHEPMVLVTSNKSDYGHPDSTNPLVQEMVDVGLTYVTDLWWASNCV